MAVLSTILHYLNSHTETGNLEEEMITSGLRECFQIREDFMEEGTFKLGLESMGRFGDVELKEKVEGET